MPEKASQLRDDLENWLKQAIANQPERVEFPDQASLNLLTTKFLT